MEGWQWSDCQFSDPWAARRRRRAGGEKLETIRRRIGTRTEQPGKTPSLPASTIESGSGRARIAKERRGSDAMARITGLNQCSPLPLFWAGSCESFPPDSMHAVVFSRKSLRNCTQNCPLAGPAAWHVLCLQCDPCLRLWSPACTPCNVNCL